MARRAKIEEAEEDVAVAEIPVEPDSGEDFSPSNEDDIYWLSDTKDVDFISSGGTLLNLILGGGWALGRMANIVGDKSSGKTLLAMEACANFRQKYPNCPVWYNEAEGAFDPGYAEALGIPMSSIFMVGATEPKETMEEKASDTIEALTRHIEKVLDYHEKNKIEAGVYVIDSMDAISDEGELGRDVSEGSYNMTKPKKIGEMFRRYVRRLEKANMLLIIVSQVRDKIGVSFGETKTRTGGKALDFYASQIVWLADIGKEKKTVDGFDRPIGANIRAKCKKNKVGLPFRECDYYLEFGFGVEDLTSCVKFLMGSKEDVDWCTENLFNMKSTTMKRLISKIRGLPDDEYYQYLDKVQKRVKYRWNAIERKLMPPRKKY